MKAELLLMCLVFNIFSGWKSNASGGVQAQSIGEGQVQTAITLSDEQISTFVNAHNDFRRNVNPPASNMRKLTWDKELAQIALLYTRKCIFKNNQNVNHSRFRSVGEIIYLSQNVPFNSNYVRQTVGNFAREMGQYNTTTGACSGNPSDCGRYAQMIWSETFKIGCGITHCSIAKSPEEAIGNAIITVCNYAPTGDWTSRSAYLSGWPCTRCSSTDSCEKKLCVNPIRDSKEIPVGSWTSWSNWSHCSASCGQSTKRRSRECDTFVPSDCRGAPVEVSLFCAPLRICPSTKGNWQPWISWSACSRSCGGGRRSRDRQCDTGNNQDCDGDAREVRLCNFQRCPSRTRAPWLDWDQWSPCTKTCGTGTRFRSRRCSSTNPFDCCGVSHEVRNCNTEICPVPVWSQWGRWYEIGESCTADTQIRKRRCSTGNPQDCCKQ